MGTCKYNKTGWCDDPYCVANGCKEMRPEDLLNRPIFEGCKPILVLRDNENLLGIIAYKGEVIIATDERTLIYNPESGLTHVVQFKDVNHGQG